MISENTEKKSVTLRILSNQIIDGTKFDQSYEYDATFYTKNNTAYLFYTDGEPCSLKSGCERVLISRHGSGSKLEMMLDVPKYSELSTPYGKITACVTAHEISDKLSECGEMTLKYTLSLNGTESNNEIYIKIEEK